jgi:hypothetical protein
MPCAKGVNYLSLSGALSSGFCRRSFSFPLLRLKATIVKGASGGQSTARLVGRSTETTRDQNRSQQESTEYLDTRPSVKTRPVESWCVRFDGSGVRRVCSALAFCRHDFARTIFPSSRDFETCFETSITCFEAKPEAKRAKLIRRTAQWYCRGRSRTPLESCRRGIRCEFIGCSGWAGAGTR